ncbi:uncharacterized protein LOC110859982 [Folsomia candida]|uniref:Centriolin n=1 Tax=Folsomia candida TaxID=158441 RepID=A0A226D979_FOLCA|nr:uncharacterized protein LOC110859982 [Folsomia candida]OXA41700.1 Centriolin [Folsomia candida]
MKHFLVLLTLTLATAWPHPRSHPLLDSREETTPPEIPGYELVELIRTPRGLRIPGESRFQEPRQRIKNNRHDRPPTVIYSPQGPPPPPQQYDPMVPSASSFKEPITAETGHGGHGHGHDYVDYGAYTGGWGAFGWYSDHPVGGGWGH